MSDNFTKQFVEDEIKHFDEMRRQAKEQSSLAASPCSAASNWYKANEMPVLLMTSPPIYKNATFTDDFCIWLSGHMNLAFQKGYEMAKREQPND